MGSDSIIVGGVSARNTRWNDYENAGKGFYKNIEPNLYGKLIHDNAEKNIIDGFRAPFAYGIAYDDVYGYSSTISSALVGTAPPASET